VTRRLWLTILSPLVALAAACATAGPASAATTTSAIFVPVNGTIFDAVTNENVAISTTVRLIASIPTDPISPDPATMRATVIFPLAFGTRTLLPYLLTGDQATTFIPSDPIIPTDPVRTADVTFTLSLRGLLPPIPTDPIRPRLRVHAAINPDGSLNATATTTTVAAPIT
jgi:hypothetical protein